MTEECYIVYNYNHLRIFKSRPLYAFLVLTIAIALSVTAFIVRTSKYSLAAGVTQTVTMNLASTYDISNQDGSSIDSFSGTTSWIGTAGSPSSSYLGMRFTGQAIPAGAQIQSAVLQITSSKTDWEILNFKAYAHNVANSAPFSATQLISQRALTTSYQAIALDEQWYLNQNYTFNLTTPVQELANNNNANSGVITLILKGNSNAYDYYFFFNGRNNTNVTKKPLLTVTYTLPSNITPTVVPTATPTIIPSPTPTIDPNATPTPTLTPSPTTVPTNTPTPLPTGSTSGIWQPTTAAPIHWHWQLSDDFVYPRDVVPGATVYDIDGEKTSAQTVAQLHALGPDIKVICYFDAGVYENYRSDASMFPQSVIGKPDTGWAGSYWLDIRQQDILLPIMRHRMVDWCQAKGFDAIEPDETEVWSNNSGFPITKAQNNSYNQAIANMAHSLSLSVGLKGNTTEAPDLWSYFDWTLNEQCWQYSECNNLWSSFGAHNKAMLNIEYTVNPNCAQSNLNHMNSARRDLNLVGPTNSQYFYAPCIPNNQNHW